MVFVFGLEQFQRNVCVDFTYSPQFSPQAEKVAIKTKFKNKQIKHIE